MAINSSQTVTDSNLRLCFVALTRAFWSVMEDPELKGAAALFTEVLTVNNNGKKPPSVAFRYTLTMD